MEVLEARCLPAALVVNTTDDNTTDTGELTLREAITLVNNAGDPASLGQSSMPAGWAAQISGNFGSNDTIQFDPSLSGSTITLDGSSLPFLSSDVSIIGPGPTQLAISGDNQFEVFAIGSVNFSLSGLSIVDGNAEFGGGVYTQGNGSITDVLFSSDSALYGGALYTRNGTLTVKNDEFDNNTASVESGAIDNWGGGIVYVTDDTFEGNSAQYGGAIGNEWGNVVASNSTFEGNQASAGDGGAIANYNPYDAGWTSNSLIVSTSTISGNLAAVGGGIANASRQTFTVQNTILSGNTASSDPDVAGKINENLGYNLFGKELAHTTSAPGDVFSNSPRLAPLGYYGGPTQTMPLLPDSPALGAGDAKVAGLPPTDERGFARAVDGGMDIGAFETQSSPYLVNTTADAASGLGVPDGLSLRDAIALANALAPPGGAVIGFNIPTSDSGYNVATGVFTIEAATLMLAISARATIDGTSQLGYAGKPVIRLDGASAGGGANGLTISGNRSTIRGLSITDFGENGIVLYGSNNQIEGDYIGVAPDGLTPQGNGTGLLIQAGSDNTVGGTTAESRNVISGNTGSGVNIAGYGTDGNVLEGDYIGTTASGEAALENDGNGITIQGEASDNTIGGKAVGAGDVISGNLYQGIAIFGIGTTDNWVVGNFIGTNPGGTTATGSDGKPLGNGIYTGCSGIWLDYGPQYNQVWDNVISGNELAGITITNDYGEGTANNVIAGNEIGTNAAGTASLANGIGIYVNGGADTIGGTTSAARNFISGNTNAGVEITGVGTSNNKVEGNSIGIGRSSASAIGNGGPGILIEAGASDNTIGGTSAHSGNDIAHNHEGVVIGDSASDTQTVGDSILGNSIWDNAGLGIDLGDTGEPDIGYYTFPGPNDMQPPAFLNEAKGKSVSGELWTAPNTRYRIEFFGTPQSDGSSEGKTFLGWVDITAREFGPVSFKALLNAAPRDMFITATVTNLATGDTSDFSLALV